MGFSDRVLKVLKDTNVQELFENIDIEVSDLDVGKSGSAGTIDIFPSTASKGKLRITCADQTNDTTVTLTTAAFSAARTVTIPDPGANADIVLTQLNQTVVGTKTFSTAVEVGTVGITGSDMLIQSLNPLTIQLNDVDALQFDNVAISSFAAATDTAGNDVFIETEDAGGTATTAITGGLYNIKTGDGSASTGNFAGGAGGALSVVSGAGGANTGGGSGQAGGAGGAIAVTSGAGGATDDTGSDNGGLGGAMTLTTGAGGASSAGTGDGGAGGAFTITIGAGAATVGGTSGVGGAFASTSGAGSAQGGNDVGGIGGASALTAGAGGANTGAGSGQAGGAGGAVTVTSGAGGTTDSTGAHAGGAGGALTMISGIGGTQTGSTTAGGVGGEVAVTAAAGGAVTTGSGVGGRGGTVTVTAGAGGAASGGSDTGGEGGDVILASAAGGTGATAGVDGNVISRGSLFLHKKLATSMTTAAVITDAQLFSGVISGTPTGDPDNYTTRTGTEISAAFGTTPVVGDSFEVTIINIAATGNTIDLVGGTAVTLVGESVIENVTDGVAAGLPASGTWIFVNTGSNAWSAYRK